MPNKEKSEKSKNINRIKLVIYLFAFILLLASLIVLISKTGLLKDFSKKEGENNLKTGRSNFQRKNTEKRVSFKQTIDSSLKISEEDKSENLENGNSLYENDVSNRSISDDSNISRYTYKTAYNNPEINAK